MLSAAEERELRSIIKSVAEAEQTLKLKVLGEEYLKKYFIRNRLQFLFKYVELLAKTTSENPIYSSKWEESQEIAEKRKLILNEYVNLMKNIDKLVDMEKEMLNQ